MEPVSKRILPVQQTHQTWEFSHGEYARTAPEAGPDSLVASHPDDGRDAGGEGKAQALAGAQVRQEARRTAWQAHDSGGAGAGRAPLRRRPSSSCPRAARRGGEGYS